MLKLSTIICFQEIISAYGSDEPDLPLSSLYKDSEDSLSARVVEGQDIKIENNSTG